MSAEPTPSSLVPIDELNRLSPERFAAAMKPLFEAAPPLAARIFAARPYRSYQELLDRAEAIVAELPPDDQLAVVNAHPRIGEPPDAVRRTSALSYREQGYDAEAGLDPDDVARVYRELAELNAAYEGRFGFRFVVFVNRRPKAAILKVLKERLARPRDRELSEALAAMLAIARDRLRSLSSHG